MMNRKQTRKDTQPLKKLINRTTKVNQLTQQFEKNLSSSSLSVNNFNTISNNSKDNFFHLSNNDDKYNGCKLYYIYIIFFFILKQIKR